MTMRVISFAGGSMILGLAAGFVVGVQWSSAGPDSPMEASPTVVERVALATDEHHHTSGCADDACSHAATSARDYVLGRLAAAAPAGHLARDRAWSAAVNDLTSGDIQFILTRWNDEPWCHLAAMIQPELVTVWARLDPLEARAWVKRAPVFQGLRTQLTSALVSGWAVVDPLAAAEWVVKECDVEERASALIAVVRPLAALDPARAFALFQQPGIELLHDEYWMGPIFAAWVARDQPAALKALFELEKEAGWAGDAFRAVVATMAQRDPAAAYAWITSGDVPDRYQDELAEGLLSTLMATDPRRGVEFARTLPAGPWRTRLHEQALGVLEDIDAAAAFALATSAPADLFGSDMALGIVGRYAERQPQAVLEWIRALPPGSKVRTGSIAAATVEIANFNSQAAEMLVFELPPGSQRDKLLGQMYGRRTGQDAEAVLRSLDALPPDVDRDRVISTLIGELAMQGDELAGVFVDALPAGSMQQQAISLVARHFSYRDDIEGGLAWLARLPESAAREEAIMELCQRLAAAHPERALTVIEAAAGTGYARDRVVSAAIFTLAERDIAAARSWVLQLPAGPVRASAAAKLVAMEHGNDPVGAMQWVETEVPPDEKAGLAGQVARTWTQHDEAAAVAWLDRMPFGAAREGFVGGLVGGIAEQSPQRAAALVARFPAGAEQRAAVKQLTQSWSARDPAAAAAWLEQSAPPDLVREEVRTVAQHWAGAAPFGAAAWLSRLKPELQRNAIEPFVRQTASVTPDLAAVWATQIPDPGERRKAIAMVGRSWLNLDPAAARQWLNTADPAALAEIVQ